MTLSAPLAQHRLPLPADLPESELVARASAGDGAAFEAIMRRHNRLLFRTARGILKNDGDAEDAVQEAYLRAWHALASYRADSRLSTWLVRITANEALGRLRRRSAQIIPLETAMTTDDPEIAGLFAEAPERGPEQAIERRQLQQLIEGQIDRLPDAFRLVFILRAVEELSVEDVAQALAIPEATVRTRYFRARSLIREGLAQKADVALADAFGFDGARCDRIVAAVLARGAAEHLTREG